MSVLSKPTYCSDKRYVLCAWLSDEVTIAEHNAQIRAYYNTLNIEPIKDELYKYIKDWIGKMITILPPPNRKDFKCKKEFKEAYNEWKKMFDSAFKYIEY